MERPLQFYINYTEENYLIGKASQGDSINMICFFFENGVTKNLENQNIQVDVKKADNTTASIAGTEYITIKNNKVTIKLPSQVTDAAGYCKLQIVIIDSTCKAVSTFPITLQIISSVMSGKSYGNFSTLLDDFHKQNINIEKNISDLNIGISQAEKNLKQIQETYVEATDLVEKVQTNSLQLEETASQTGCKLLGIKDGDDITEELNAALLLGSGVINITLDGTFLVGNIKLPSNRVICLGNNTTLKLKDNVGKPMFENDDNINGNSCIGIKGGTLDFNNIHQARLDENGKVNSGLRFNNVKHLTLENVKIKNPRAFGIQLANVEHFNVDGINFDYNLEYPNMDGLHLNGNCRNGHINNIYGDTSDDLIALNANDGDEYDLQDGEISDITIENVNAPYGFRAVRVLSGGDPIGSDIHNVTIKNIRGKYKHGGVYFSNYNLGKGNMYNITLENINPTVGDEAAVLIDSDIKILNIKGMQRNNSEISSKEFVRVAKGKTIDLLNVDNAQLTDNTTDGFAMFNVLGTVNKFNVSNVSRVRPDETKAGTFLSVDGGTIKKLNLNNIIASNFWSTFRLLNGGSIGDMKIMNTDISDVTNYGVEVKNGSIDTLELCNTHFSGFGGNDIRLEGLTKPIFIKTNNCIFSHSMPLYMVAGQTVRLVSLDLVTDPILLTPLTHDIVINNNSDKGTLGLCQYTGSVWKSLVDGTTLNI